MSRKKNQSDQKADTRGGPWIGLPKVVLTSSAYTSLDKTSRVVLIELLAQFNGYNNGIIAMSYDQLCQRLQTTNKRAISSAIRQLLDRGLIEITEPANWRHHKARCYRITFVSTGTARHPIPATNEYKNWKPEPIKHRDDVSPKGGVCSDMVAGDGPSRGDEVTLRILEYRRKKGNSAKVA